MKLQITRRMDNISIDIPIDEIFKHSKAFDGMFLLRNGIPADNVKNMPNQVKKAMAEQLIKDLKGN